MIDMMDLPKTYMEIERKHLTNIPLTWLLPITYITNVLRVPGRAHRWILVTYIPSCLVSICQVVVDVSQISHQNYCSKVEGWDNAELLQRQQMHLKVPVSHVVHLQRRESLPVTMPLPLTNCNSRGGNHKNHRIRERFMLEETLHVIYFQPTHRGEGCHPVDHEQKEEKAEHKKMMKP